VSVPGLSVGKAPGGQASAAPCCGAGACGAGAHPTVISRVTARRQAERNVTATGAV
jgi:hypothetical protein